MSIRGDIDSAEEQACAAQVRSAAATGKVFGRDYEVNAPACQTKYATITATEDSKVKKQLAEAMRTCAYQWGRGELDLFNHPGYYCAPCSNIEFSEETRKLYAKTNGNILDFDEYLRETKTPGGKLTYAEYLAGVTRDNGVQSEGSVGALAINTNENYTVLFTYDKQKTDGDLLQQFGDLIGTDITPAEEAKILGTASGIAAGLGTATATAAGASGLVVAAIASGPIGWVALGAGTIAVGGFAIYKGLKTYAIVGTITYFSARSSEEWYIVSATYITPNDPESVYVKACGQMAEATRSP
jgi:hypothetical protein